MSQRLCLLVFLCRLISKRISGQQNESRRHVKRAELQGFHLSTDHPAHHPPNTAHHALHIDQTSRHAMVISCPSCFATPACRRGRLQKARVECAVRVIEACVQTMRVQATARSVSGDLASVRRKLDAAESEAREEALAVELALERGGGSATRGRCRAALVPGQESQAELTRFVCGSTGLCTTLFRSARLCLTVSAAVRDLLLVIPSGMLEPSVFWSGHWRIHSYRLIGVVPFLRGWFDVVHHPCLTAGARWKKRETYRGVRARCSAGRVCPPACASFPLLVSVSVPVVSCLALLLLVCDRADVAPRFMEHHKLSCAAVWRSWHPASLRVCVKHTPIHPLKRRLLDPWARAATAV